ncbi:hypothetical protein DSO57_1033112, partial [Entomophthora muscae]
HRHLTFSGSASYPTAPEIGCRCPNYTDPGVPQPGALSRNLSNSAYSEFTCVRDHLDSPPVFRNRFLQAEPAGG